MKQRGVHSMQKVKMLREQSAIVRSNRQVNAVIDGKDMDLGLITGIEKKDGSLRVSTTKGIIVIAGEPPKVAQKTQ